MNHVEVGKHHPYIGVEVLIEVLPCVRIPLQLPSVRFEEDGLIQLKTKRSIADLAHTTLMPNLSTTASPAIFTRSAASNRQLPLPLEKPNTNTNRNRRDE
jgi:hypothetical protein